MTQSQLARLAPDATPEAVVEVIMRDGGVVIEGLFGDSTIEGIKKDLDPVLDEVDNGHDEVFAGNRTKRASGLFARTEHMATIALNPLYRSVAERILNKPINIFFGEESVPNPTGMHVGATMAIKIGPGQGAQPLHRDDSVWLWRHPTYQREARVQIMVAVSDFTAGNGGTLVIPGSHLWDDERPPRLDEAVPTEMKAGSALIWIGSTYHGGGRNTTADQYRFGLSMGYDLAFLRPEENPFLTYTLDQIRSFPEEIQRALDWSSEHYVGWVEVDGQMSDPMDLLGRDDYTAIGAGLPGRA
ncbi:phytanoyl-CoA dioxygenase family protein [Pseudonocardia sp. C8]|uniref:phytanoyl-CoA dioxygenase family protein n=1 Tax=Pseudonocardia sp. C8 TaxID=2762759 RepID=UPI00164349AF|nr:phytanoyl-CoA dioxygenase family protein [Pseudonocardia sp. C8]MBC3189960.1 phytanoyl-CoA dioxygenase family protein [Pseudonocardia sp. C8]